MLNRLTDPSAGRITWAAPDGTTIDVATLKLWGEDNRAIAMAALMVLLAVAVIDGASRHLRLAIAGRRR